MLNDRTLKDYRDHFNMLIPLFSKQLELWQKEYPEPVDIHYVTPYLDLPPFGRVDGRMSAILYNIDWLSHAKLNNHKLEHLENIIKVIGKKNVAMLTILTTDLKNLITKIDYLLDDSNKEDSDDWKYRHQQMISEAYVECDAISHSIMSHPQRYLFDPSAYKTVSDYLAENKGKSNGMHARFFCHPNRIPSTNWHKEPCCGIGR